MLSYLHLSVQCLHSGLSEVVWQIGSQSSERVSRILHHSRCHKKRNVNATFEEDLSQGLTSCGSSDLHMLLFFFVFFKVLRLHLDIGDKMSPAAHNGYVHKKKWGINICVGCYPVS